MASFSSTSSGCSVRARSRHSILLVLLLSLLMAPPFLLSLNVLLCICYAGPCCPWRRGDDGADGTVGGAGGSDGRGAGAVPGAAPGRHGGGAGRRQAAVRRLRVPPDGGRRPARELRHSCHGAGGERWRARAAAAEEAAKGAPAGGAGAGGEEEEARGGGGVPADDTHRRGAQPAPPHERPPRLAPLPHPLRLHPTRKPPMPHTRIYQFNQSMPQEIENYNSQSLLIRCVCLTL